MKRTVKDVIDGCTFIVGKKIGCSYRVRLVGVPQCTGKAATERLRKLIAGKTVTIIPIRSSKK